MSSEKLDPAAWAYVRPAEIKTYHRTTYDRISPSSTFDGKGKTVLVTAGAVGIGFAIAESFAKAGVERLVLIQRRQHALDTAKQALEPKYSNTKVTTYVASVTDFGRISEIVKQVGKIDVLVANAAMSHPFVPSKDVTVEDFKATFDTKVVGPRQVILTSSAAGQMVQPGNIGYGPSKAAASQLVQHFAAENIDTNVTVHAFHPGVIHTESVAGLVPEQTFEWDDVRLSGDFAVWLASPEAKFLAGRFVWAQWDVDELLAIKGRVTANPGLLTTTVVL